ncbi:MAG: hypothetical protein ACR2KP_03330 [Egibacteraceae bacterium]
MSRAAAAAMAGGVPARSATDASAGERCPDDKLVGQAARWIAGSLAGGRILETTDAEGHALARQLGAHAGIEDEISALLDDLIPEAWDRRHASGQGS